MSKILELREKRAKAWDAAKQFLDAKRGADGMLSEEDTATYDKMEQDVMNLGKEIERLERQVAIDAELSKATSTPLTGKPGAKMGKDEKEKSGRASDEYKNNMTELYFEDSDIEGFAKKLEASEFEIEYLNELMEHSWGQKVIRFYDPDGNLIEVGTPVN